MKKIIYTIKNPANGKQVGKVYHSMAAAHAARRKIKSIQNELSSYAICIQVIK